ncbi:MAG: hypothetical protein WCR31_00995 [Treponema sp.]
MIKSLKKSLQLIPAYLGILLFNCVIGMLIYMLYFNTTELIAGKLLQLFDRHILLEGFFVVIPVVLVLSGTLLSCYRIRHSGGGVLPVIMYSLLGAVTWCILYPSFIELKKNCQVISDSEKTALTAGYFRSAGNDIIYFPQIPVSADVEAVVINVNEVQNGAVSLQKINYPQVVYESAPFKDSLIRETIPTMPGWIMEGFAAIEVRAENAWHAGYINWLCFISFGLALFSVYSLTFCSEWRLINIIYLLLMEAGVLSFNLLYFSDYFLPLRKLSIRIVNNFNFLTHLDEPLLVCINVFLTLVFICIGVTTVLTKKQKNKRRSV